MSDNTKLTAEWQKIEEICKPYGGFVNVITNCGGTTVSQLWIKSMQEYSTLRVEEETAILKKELEKWELMYESKQEQCVDFHNKLSSQSQYIDKLVEALKYAKRFLNPKDHDINFIEETLNQYKK